MEKKKFNPIPEDKPNGPVAPIVATRFNPLDGSFNKQEATSNENVNLENNNKSSENNSKNKEVHETVEGRKLRETLERKEKERKEKLVSEQTEKTKESFPPEEIAELPPEPVAENETIDDVINDLKNLHKEIKKIPRSSIDLDLQQVIKTKKPWYKFW